MYGNNTTAIWHTLYINRNTEMFGIYLQIKIFFDENFQFYFSLSADNCEKNFFCI